MTTPSVFINYSHDSPEHGDRVLAFADRLVQDGIDVILDQYESSPPEGWPRWMEKHIRKAEFVLMVCTETYFLHVMGEEKPGTGLGVKWEGNLIYQHICNADTKNTRFIPVLLDYCKVEHIPTPLQGATYYCIDSSDGYEELYRRITNQPGIKKPELGKLRTLPPRVRKLDYLGIKISTAKLPSTSPDLFGRDKELAILEVAWDNPNINVLSLVAWGGVGKTALVNKWLRQLARDNYRGAERVYGWSFYSQGAAEGRQVSADQFIAAALAWFGDPDPTRGSPWDKGERLAELVKHQRTLLIIDGLEPLQNPPPLQTGRIKDPGLCCLLRELARQNPGLVVITTRLTVDDLKDFAGSSAVEIDLENLSTEAGAAYLTHLGVMGTAEELARAADDFGGHALALTLMGSYLKVVYGGDVRQHEKIERLMDEKRQGAHARRVMETYERWFMGKPELDILRLMGLFDRPAERGAMDALRKEPPIQHLTSHLQTLSHADWQYAVENLRAARLLSAPAPHDPEMLDCHPLLREHLGEKLKKSNLKAWREAHSRLYEYYKARAKEYPDTIEEMAPLFAAVAHGCQGGRYQEALVEIYWRRIRRTKEAFNVKKLGACGADLATLSGFFDMPWRKPVDGLRKDSKAFALNEVGFNLRALGRLAEAAQPMQAGLEADIGEKDWWNAAVGSSNLSELYVTLGDLTQALAYARQSVELAERSGDDFQRMARRATLGDALHQVGHLEEAEAAFREAEEMQKAQQTKFPLLYSFAGFCYCDLLLSQGKYGEVQRRAGQTLEWARRERILLDIALDHLSLGCAYLLQAQSEGTCDFAQATTHLDRAVDGLRQAATQHMLPLALLARAELHRATGGPDRARHDLDEAFTIATRGGMRLHEGDCHLEYARLYLACGQKGKARESLAKAKKMVEEIGYHRRDSEVKELEARL
jgi:tetratricopeptide (TPR) repeat protein